MSGSLVWSEIDSATARATITHGGIAASGEFHFDDDGNVLAFTANRWMGGGQEVAMERWFVPSKEWSIINGVKIPTKGDVIWKLDSGDFNYYRWEITGIEYDSFELFTQVRSQ